jgi:hypothetical protein
VGLVCVASVYSPASKWTSAMQARVRCTLAPTGRFGVPNAHPNDAFCVGKRNDAVESSWHVAEFDVHVEVFHCSIITYNRTAIFISICNRWTIRFRMLCSCSPLRQHILVSILTVLLWNRSGCMIKLSPIVCHAFEILWRPVTCYDDLVHRTHAERSGHRIQN